MIHELSQEMFELPLEDYILTFDDGLYTQYKYLEQLKALQTPKIFFVSTNLVRGAGTVPSDEFLYCGKAHEKAFNGNLENYMSWDEILEIHNTDGCVIVGHRHDHLKLWEMKSTRARFNNLTQDTKSMIKTFKNKGIKIDSYCFPYNYVDPLLSGVLKRLKIPYLYSERVEHLNKERIGIEKAFSI